MIKRGDIIFANYPGSKGHAQGFKNRPWVVVQNDIGNELSGITIVCPMTKKFKHPLPTHVSIVWGSISVTVMCEQIRVVDQEDFKVVEHLPDEIMEHIDRALAVAVGLITTNEKRDFMTKLP